MKIEDILGIGCSSLVVTTPDTPIKEAIDVLSERNIGALPVCDASKKVVGILSERDVVRWLSDHASELNGIKVGDLMTKEVSTCEEDYDLRDVMKVMNARGIRHMPVVSKGQLTAMVSSRDILETLLEDMNAYATKMTLNYELMR